MIMRILWFEVTEPSAYKNGEKPIAGWQDSLERVVRTIPDIELIIAFNSETETEEKMIDGVTYVPIFLHWGFVERRTSKYWDAYIKKMLPEAKKIVDKYTPDLIQVFGTEWHFGQIATLTPIPVVIHIMGAIVPYNNAWYPPGFSYEGQILKYWHNPLKVIQYIIGKRNRLNWEEWEKRTWDFVNHYMGRTQWDESLSRVMHPDRYYYHVDEALRTVFLTGERRWALPKSGKIHILSTGCKTYWKGPDMMLKVARILLRLKIDFEWLVAGQMAADIKKSVEENEGVHFEDCNIHILGYKQPDELVDLLCSSTLYVHTAYIENSPNSICEAQCLGVPVVCTNVGGVSSLVRDGIDGILVPANDPWQMADAIIQLAADKERMQKYSDNSRVFALKRHNDESIKKQLLACYNSMIK